MCSFFSTSSSVTNLPFTIGQHLSFPDSKDSQITLVIEAGGRIPLQRFKTTRISVFLFINESSEEEEYKLSTAIPPKISLSTFTNKIEFAFADRQIYQDGLL